MIVFLDTGPLGGITNPTPRSEEVKALQLWAKQMEQSGHVLIVPAVVDYEQRREHLRRNATESIAALDAFIAATPSRYLYLSDSALKRAAAIWADLRQHGLPTADVKALDGDVILAAQVLDLNLQPEAFRVATGNVDDLARMVACDIWQNIHFSRNYWYSAAGNLPRSHQENAIYYAMLANVFLRREIAFNHRRYNTGYGSSD